MAAAGPNLVDEFEASFQNCISALSTQEHYNITDPDEVKTSVDHMIQRFLDAAKQLDGYFLQQLLVLAAHKPEQVLQEDIEELRGELMRKEMLTQKHYEKLQQWQLVLNRSQGPAGTAGTAQMPPGMAQPPQPGMPLQHQPPIPTPAQMGPAQPGTPTGAPPHPMGPPIPGPYSQGPLAFLEQTTSSIGRTDRR